MQDLVLLVDVDLDGEVVNVTQSVLVRQRQQANLVECVRRVGDKLAQENVLALVERVDNQLHHAVDLSLELVLLRLVAQKLGLGRAQSVQLDGALFAFHSLSVRASALVCRQLGLHLAGISVVVQRSVISRLVRERGRWEGKEKERGRKRREEKKRKTDRQGRMRGKSSSLQVARTGLKAVSLD